MSGFRRRLARTGQQVSEEELHAAAVVFLQALEEHLDREHDITFGEADWFLAWIEEHVELSEWRVADPAEKVVAACRYCDAEWTRPILRCGVEA